MKATAKYLARHAQVRQLHSASASSIGDTGCDIVVIPARAEADTLPHTLDSLVAAVDPERPQELVVIVVVNASIDTESSVRQNNQRTLETLKSASQYPYRLAWIDATGNGRELPSNTGVGLARKIGADSALAAMDADASGSTLLHRLHTTRIFHLDADCEVRNNYVSACRDALTRHDIGAATIDIRHPVVALPPGIVRRSIAEYECFLRYCVEGLRYAGSPYGFATVGSGMVSTAAAYVKAGGMPAKRTAGEDFYFLQQLAKTTGLVTVTDTWIEPACRASNRVPFGTGPYLAAALNSGMPEPRFYPFHCFEQLRLLHMTIADFADSDYDTIVVALQKQLAPAALEFVLGGGLETVWKRFQRESRSSKDFMRKFHTWFDYLATIRFLHRTSSSARLSYAQAWPEFGTALDLKGIPETAEMALELLRHRQEKERRFGIV